METIKVKIINKSHHPLPAYATPGSAGMDVRAFLPDGAVTLGPLERRSFQRGSTCSFPTAMNARFVRAAAWP